MRTRVGEADPALSRLLTIHFDKASIDVLEGAPTIFLSVHPGNDEIPTFRFGVPILRFDHMGVEAVPWLHLAKNDVPLFDFMCLRHWRVGAFVSAFNLWPQRITRTSIFNCCSLEECFLNHGVPKVPETYFFVIIFWAKRPVYVQGWRDFVVVG